MRRGTSSRAGRQCSIPGTCRTPCRGVGNVSNVGSVRWGKRERDLGGQNLLGTWGCTVLTSRDTKNQRNRQRKKKRCVSGAPNFIFRSVKKPRLIHIPRA